MSAEVERRLRELAPRLQRLGDLKAERERQRGELTAAEELLKQLKWTSYQTEQAFRREEESGGGFFSGLFSSNKAKLDELFEAAAEARDAYQAAKDKLKPLKEEFAQLEREIDELEAARPEYEAALEAKMRAAAAASGASGSRLQELEEQSRSLVGLMERCEHLHRKAQKMESLLHRCERSNLFTIRAEFSAFQKEFSVFILESASMPKEWSLPPLPAEADVRMLDPVGVGSRIHAPDSTEERMIELASFGHGFNLHAEQKRMRAVINAGHASDEAVRQQGRFHAILVGEWANRLGRFAQALNRAKALNQQQLEALLLPAAAASPEAAADESFRPSAP